MPRDPIGAGSKTDPEQHAENDAHGRGQEAVVDRQLDEEGATERQRQPTEPDEPVLGQDLLPPVAGRERGRSPPLPGTARRAGRPGGGHRLRRWRLGRGGNRLHRWDRRRYGGRRFEPLQPLVELEQPRFEAPHLARECLEPGVCGAAAQDRCQRQPEGGKGSDGFHGAGPLAARRKAAHCNCGTPSI